MGPDVTSRDQFAVAPSAHAPRIDQEMTQGAFLMNGEWHRWYLELEEFVAKERRLPQSTINGRRPSVCEADLYRWLRRQRRREAELIEWQWQLLDVLHPRVWEPRQADWERRHLEYVRFVQERGAPPRARSTELAERSLAHWMARQRRLLRDRRLPADRAALLRSAST